MSLVTDVYARVRANEPDTSDRWTDAVLLEVFQLVDRLVREESSMYHSYQDITLTDDTVYYDLDKELVQVDYVEMLTDGSDVDGRIDPTTALEMDGRYLGRTWYTDTGSEPTRYFLSGTPGTNSQAQIGLWPRITSVASQVVRVHGVFCLTTTDGTAASVDIDDAYVPMMLTILLAPYDANAAGWYLEKYISGITRVRVRYEGKYGDGLGQRLLGGGRLV